MLDNNYNTTSFGIGYRQHYIITFRWNLDIQLFLWGVINNFFFLPVRYRGYRLSSNGIETKHAASLFKWGYRQYYHSTRGIWQYFLSFLPSSVGFILFGPMPHLLSSCGLSTVLSLCHIQTISTLYTSFTYFFSLVVIWYLKTDQCKTGQIK